MPIPEFIKTLRAKVGHDLLHLPSVGVLARDAEGRLLIVQDSDDGTWTCPGGLVEPFEIPADAAVREAWEESGVLVRLTGIAGVFGGPECYTNYANGDRISWVATIFSAEVVSGTATPDGQETTAARFATDAELATLPLKAHLQLFLRGAGKGEREFFEAARWAPEAG